MEKTQLRVELIDGCVIARVRGEPSERILRECQEQVLQLAKQAGCDKVLYDAREMDAPPVDVPLSQWKLDKEMAGIKLKRAIVVPDSKLAYLARLAFGEEDHRVFYNDVAAAIEWLKA